MGLSRGLKRRFLIEREDAALIRELARRMVKRGMLLWGVVKELEREAIERALDVHGGNATQAAEALGLHRNFVMKWRKGRPSV